MTTPNTLRRLNWLWKHRHTHDDDDTQDQIEVIREIIEREADTDAQPGAFIHVSRDASQTIAVDGEAVEWDTQSNVFPPLEFKVTLPTTEITIPRDGYYDLLFEVHWDSWHGGGDAWVTRTRSGFESQIWPREDAVSTGWSSSYGSEFLGSATGVALKLNDIVKIYVDHGDSSTQDVSYAALTVDQDGFLGGFAAPTTYRETVLADEPIAYWRLDEPTSATATDETGNGHDGTYDSGVDQGVDGLIANDPDRAAKFNGDSNSVDIPIHADLKFIDADYTLELWCSIPSTSTVSPATLFGWTNGPRWSIGFDTFNAGDGRIRFVGERDGSQLVRSTDTFAFDTTHHVVVTYDASTDQGVLYVNGSQKDAASQSGSITDGSTAIRIGRDTGSGKTATIDEVAVYDKVLTADQVREHYTVGVG